MYREGGEMLWERRSERGRHTHIDIERGMLWERGGGTHTHTQIEREREREREIMWDKEGEGWPTKRERGGGEIESDVGRDSEGGINKVKRGFERLGVR